MNKIKRSHILIATVYIVVVASFTAVVYSIAPKKISNANAAGYFEDYVCSPIPNGVYEIGCVGVVSFASTSINISFRVESDDVLQKVVSDGGFKPVDVSLPKAEPSDGNVSKYSKTTADYEHVELHYDRSSSSCDAYYRGG